MSQTRPAPQPPPALIAEATKRAGLIWITIEGQGRPRPAWHVWRAGTGPTGPGSPGAAYVLTGPGEQPLPGLAGAGRVAVIVAGGQAAGGRVDWTAAVGRVEPGSTEWDEVIGPLVAGRLNAALAEGETSPAQRWATSGAVFRLAPLVQAPNSRILLSTALLSVHPDRRLAGHRQRRHCPLASQPSVWRHPFHAEPGTPGVNGLTAPLLTHNRNSANPQRLTPAQALTCDQDHGYNAEQKAMDGGLMDKFVEETGVSTCSPPNYQRHVQLGPPQLRAVSAGPGHGRTHPLITGVGGTGRRFLPHRQD